MGYQSDVAHMFYSRCGETIPYAMLKFWFEENYPHKQATDEWGAEITYMPEKRAILIEYKGVKWYDDYTHVDAVSQAIKLFAETFETEDKCGAAYESVRIGEEDTDIEDSRSYHHDYRLIVERKIALNFY